MRMPKFECAADTQAMVVEFENADQAWKAAMLEFETAHRAELEQLEKLREERNSRLDEARHYIRRDAEEAPIDEVKGFKVGPFTVQKKWSAFYNAEKLVAQLKDGGLYDVALSHGVVCERVEVGRFDQIKAFLENQRDKDLIRKFEGCEDGKEMTPAISGPKPAVGFGGESKDR
jgi:hypothetical protein